MARVWDLSRVCELESPLCFFANFKKMLSRVDVNREKSIILFSFLAASSLAKASEKMISSGGIYNNLKESYCKAK